MKIGRSRVNFASLEDVVIHKMVAGRPRDLEDVRAILRKNPGYDADYIDRWLRDFEEALGERFRESLKEITDGLSA
ncbi:MAG: hypothetical protein Kow00128_16500 [Deltaproteobacteria bacterium]